MFAEYFHHPPIVRNMIVNRHDRPHRSAILHRKDISETIGIGLVRTEEAEVLLLGVSRKRVSQQLAELARRLMALRCWLGHVKRIAHNGGRTMAAQHLAPLTLGMGSHPR